VPQKLQWNNEKVNAGNHSHTSELSNYKAELPMDISIVDM
jgi:hypothetical protein